MGIVATAFVLRAALALLHPMWFDDSRDYVALGQAMAAGANYQVGGMYAARMPGYPALIAAVFRVVGPGAVGIGVLLILQAALGAACCYLTYLLGRCGSEGVGLVAAALVALDPLSVAFSAAVLSETPFTFLLLLALVLVGQIRTAPERIGWWLMLGVVGGATVYMRASAFWLMLVVLPVIARAGSPLASAVPAASRGTGLRQRGGFLICLCCVLLMLAPWWIRLDSRAATHGIRFTSLEGLSLYEVVYPEADGGPRQDKIALPPAMRGLTEGERNAAWNRRAWQCMLTEPGRILRLAPLKLARTWSPIFNTELFGQWPIQAAMFAWHVPLYLLALLGLAVAWRCRAAYWVVLAPVLYFTCLHAIYMGSVRYRAPLMPLVLLLAAAGLMWLWDRRRQRSANSRV